ncbi:tyrosine-type recombinase/integrase [Lachnospiraceae bacterium 54-53]
MGRQNYLFTQLNGRQMYPSTPYGMFKKIIRWHNEAVTKEEDKLPEIPLHGLRHTSATLLISQNVDIRTVSGRLGHAQASTTTDIYSHFLQKADEAASDPPENLFHFKAK